MASSKRQVLALYKSLRREAQKFSDYNFREYFLRRTRDSFNANKTESNPEKIKTLLDDARQNLEIAKRQVVIGQMYGEGKLVIENQGKPQPG